MKIISTLAPALTVAALALVVTVTPHAKALVVHGPPACAACVHHLFPPPPPVS